MREPPEIRGNENNIGKYPGEHLLNRLPPGYWLESGEARKIALPLSLFTHLVIIQTFVRRYLGLRPFFGFGAAVQRVEHHALYALPHAHAVEFGVFL